MTNPAVMIHPGVIEAKAFKDKKTGKEKGEPKFGGSFLFAAEDPELAEIQKHLVAVAKAEWPKPYRLDRKKMQLRATKTAGGKTVWDDDVLPVDLPLKDGDKAADARRDARVKAGKSEDEKGIIQRGKIVLKGSSKFAPRLGVLANGRIAELETEEARKANKSKFYFGAEALATFNFKPMEVDGERFIVCYLQSVLVTGKGKKIAGGQSLADTFSKYVGQASAEDPLGGEEEVSDDE